MAANAAAGTAPSSSSAAGRHTDLPSDAVAVRNILKTMGVEQHEPRVVNMLLDFVYSYVSGVLSDAAAYAEQVGRPAGEVENEDVVLAVQTRAQLSFVPQPPVELVRSLADQVNNRRLPEFDPRAGFGLRVPPDEHLLVQPNWRINVAAHQQGHAQRGTH
uniref:Transcription initiation factor TFIID subunit 9 n=1 Tax=Tetradesmus obliquus TaxID=3088 RepID=A0A383VX94_TETOB|eukprot:jgi/Sobl393_1/18905/SZX69036.1